jgi:hypothetical protein
MQANPKPGTPGDDETVERAILALAMAVYPHKRAASPKRRRAFVPDCIAQR